MGKGIAFQLFGFPVSIQGSFVLLVAFLGYLSFPNDLGLAIAFLVVAIFAVLVHELGHAFAARRLGTSMGPTISLEGMAGLTRYRPASQPSRGQSIFVSFAGPLAGILLGVLVFAIRESNVVETTNFTHNLFRIGLFTTFGWSAFNLLPIVPLDGGHIMTDMIPGNQYIRRRRAAVVSIVFSLVAGLFLWQAGIIFGAIILAMMAFQNFSILTAPAPTARVAAPPIVRDDEPDLH